MASTAVASPRLSAERALNDLIRERDIPGAGFAASRDGEIVVNTAAGVCNVVTGMRATTDTVWQPGSIGKTYTAVLVMQLVDDGLLDLDAPVLRYLPELRFADSHATRTVTARQLLSHTSGIDGDRIDETGALFGRGDDAVTRYVASLVDLPQIAEPGRLWSYCNAGYVVLGRLIEVLRGMTYEQALAARVLAPAALVNTFSFAEDVMQRNFSSGHMPGPGGTMVLSPIWMPGRACGPAGTAVVATMSDLLGFAEILLRRGVARNGTRILSEHSVLEMERPLVDCPERELLGGHWGLGVLVKPGPPSVYGHDGNTFGQTASLRYIPERHIAYALITNRMQANRSFGELSRTVVDEWAGITTEAQRAPIDGLRVQHPEVLSGTYENIAAALTVEPDDAQLTLRFRVKRETAQGFDERPRALRPLDETTWLVHLDEADDDLQVAFLDPAANGRPEYLHFGGRSYRRTS